MIAGNRWTLVSNWFVGGVTTVRWPSAAWSRVLRFVRITYHRRIGFLFHRRASAIFRVVEASGRVYEIVVNG